MSKLFRAGFERLRKLESLLGFTVFGLFFISSMLLNNTVQALNQAAGNYGYYLGTYGYNAEATSSDDLPSAPTTLVASGQTTAAITFSWTAPTTTASGTSLNNLTGYCYKSAASSAPSNCTLTDSTTTATSVTLTGLTPSTTYHLNVRAYDGNSNLSTAALTGSSATNAEVGGGGGGAAASSVTPSSTPAATPATPAVPAAAGAGPATPATPAVPAAPPLPQKFVAPVAKVETLTVKQLTSTAAVAKAAGLATNVVARQLGPAQQAVRADLKVSGVKFTGNVEKSLANVLAAASALNPELKKTGQLNAFVKKFLSTQGKKALQAASKNTKQGEQLVERFFAQALAHKAPAAKAKPVPAKKKAPVKKAPAKKK